MPSNATAKIKSALRYPPLWTALVLLVAVVVLAAWIMLAKLDTSTKLTTQAGDTMYVYYLDEAAGARQFKKGLSGRPSMPRDKGMLFVFDKEEKQCFWMKDMLFNLDIIWIDTQKKVVRVEHDVSPETYPKAFCSEHTKYVIELNAGEAAKASIRTGRILNF